MIPALVSENTPSLYEQLLELPEHLIGEIINGRLYTQPRPTKPHTLACASLEIDLGAAYQKGRGGPGGWWILVEPEVHFVVTVHTPLSLRILPMPRTPALKGRATLIQSLRDVRMLRLTSRSD